MGGGNIVVKQHTVSATNRWTILVVLGVVLLPATVSADLYRCVSKEGVPIYSDQPCGGNAKTIAHSMRVDDWIALSRPYRQPRHDPNRISKDLRSHSKKIGDHIIPGGRYVSRSTGVGNDRRMVWIVELKYKTEEHHPWRIVITYTKKPEGSEYRLWLTSISVFKWGAPCTPPTMQQVTLLRQTGTGMWIAPNR